MIAHRIKHPPDHIDGRRWLSVLVLLMSLFVSASAKLLSGGIVSARVVPFFLLVIPSIRLHLVLSLFLDLFFQRSNGSLAFFSPLVDLFALGLGVRRI